HGRLGLGGRPSGGVALGWKEDIRRRTCNLPTGSFLAATLAGSLIGLLAASGRSHQRCRRTECAAGTQMKRITKTRAATQTKLKQEMWAVLVRAPLRKDRWWQFWKPVGIILGLKVLAVPEFAELLGKGLPELAPEKALQVAGQLVESAFASDDRFGTAVVVGDCKSAQVAEECRRRLRAENPDMNVSVEQMP
ncbi:unnamed protein product, partial [Polarella glacialis]